MFWHIHYTKMNPNASLKKELETFHDAFVYQFRDKFPKDEVHCPFGGNYGAYSSSIFPAKTMCALGKQLEFEIAEGVDVQGNPWGSLTQAAFFVPIELIDEAWEW